MDDRSLSKLLALALRHHPERLGVELDHAGWVDVDELLAGLAGHGRPVTRAQLERVVARSDKQRFSLDPATDRIRANQGHSVPVDLGLAPREPPAVLFHGTAERSVEPIFSTGLNRRGRHAVHLSPDVATARRVGSRRGPSVVLAVDAARMHEDGHTFAMSANGVWLVDAVPPEYLSLSRPSATEP